MTDDSNMFLGFNETTSNVTSLVRADIMDFNLDYLPRGTGKLETTPNSIKVNSYPTKLIVLSQ
jgi:hypothetical protein